MKLPTRAAPRRATLAATIACALVLGACAGGAESDAPGAPTDDSDGAATPEDASDDTSDDTSEDATEDTTGDGSVTLLTHDSFDVSEEVLAAFEASSGIEVTIVPLGDAGSALNQAILTQDAPLGDVLFGVDTSFLSRALDADLFAPYSSPLLADVPERYHLDPELRATPIDVGDVCLNYDVAWFEDAGLPVPQDLADLTDPAYADLLVVQNAATSSPGLSFLLATIDRFGEDGYLDYWSDLRDNGVLVVDGWSEAYYGEFTIGGGGDRPLVVSYASSPPAEVFFADPQPEVAPTGVIEASCFRQIEFAGILASTPRQAEAEALIDFLLSPAFQEDVPLRMFVFPVNETVALPDVFVQHAVVPADPLELDPAVIGANREAWIEAWTAAVLR